MDVNYTKQLKEASNCPPYQFFKVCIPLWNEPIGLIKKGHLKNIANVYIYIYMQCSSELMNWWTEVVGIPDGNWMIKVIHSCYSIQVKIMSTLCQIQGSYSYPIVSARDRSLNIKHGVWWFGGGTNNSRLLAKGYGDHYCWLWISRHN